MRGDRSHSARGSSARIDATLPVRVRDCSGSRDYPRPAAPRRSVAAAGVASSGCDDGLGPDGALTFVQVSAGSEHTCAISTDGQAFCWGRNTFGQLGDGTTTNSARPVPIVGGPQFGSIAAGVNHTCAVDLNNTAFCWGDGIHGKLGTGSLSAMEAPAPVAGAKTVARSNNRSEAWPSDLKTIENRPPYQAVAAASLPAMVVA